MSERISQRQRQEKLVILEMMDLLYSPDILEEPLARTSAHLAILQIYLTMGKIHETDLARERAFILDKLASVSRDAARELRKIEDIGTLVWLANGHDIRSLSNPAIAKRAKESFQE